MDGAFAVPGSVPASEVLQQQGAPPSVPVAPPAASPQQQGQGEGYWIQAHNSLRQQNEALQRDLADWRQVQERASKDPEIQRRLKWAFTGDPSLAPAPAGYSATPPPPAPSYQPPPAAAPPSSVPAGAPPVAAGTPAPAQAQAGVAPELQQYMQYVAQNIGQLAQMQQQSQQALAQQNERFNRWQQQQDLDVANRQLDSELQRLGTKYAGFDADERQRLMMFMAENRNVTKVEDIEPAYHKMLYYRGQQAQPAQYPYGQTTAPPQQQMPQVPPQYPQQGQQAAPQGYYPPNPFGESGYAPAQPQSPQYQQQQYSQGYVPQPQGQQLVSSRPIPTPGRGSVASTPQQSGPLYSHSVRDRIDMRERSRRALNDQQLWRDVAQADALATAMGRG